MLSSKASKPSPLPSSPLLSSKLKDAKLVDDDAVPASTTTASNGAAEERQEMKQFWEEHSKTATVEEMMLDSKASEIDLQERPEVSGDCVDGGLSLFACPLCFALLLFARAGEGDGGVEEDSRRCFLIERKRRSFFASFEGRRQLLAIWEVAL